MASSSSSGNGTNPDFNDFINGAAGTAQQQQGITTKAFALNLAAGIGLFLFEVIGFFLLKSSNIGRRIYQPKTYLVQDRLRVEAVPASPLKWIRRIFTIKNDDLKVKCGLDGYFYIRFIRAMIVIFLPMMAILVTVLFPVNFHGGRNKRKEVIDGVQRNFNVTGLDTLAWQNVAPTETDRYWAHLVCALLAIGWTLYRIYREKIHFIGVRQQYLASPEHRIKASARTVLITNIPAEFRSVEALEAMYDVFVADDRSKLHVWLNRDYGPLKTLVLRCRKLRHALEKEELKILRLVNKHRRGKRDVEADESYWPPTSSDGCIPDDETKPEVTKASNQIHDAFEADCGDHQQLWQRYAEGSKLSQIAVIEDETGNWTPVRSWYRGKKRNVPKVAWLRQEIARLTLEIEEQMRHLDSDSLFERQNSAFIQFDRQMAAQMAVSLVSHHQPGCMTPRYFNVAPHEILWPNMGLTSFARFVRGCAALVLFAGMLVFWGVPVTFLGFLSQLETLRQTTSWLYWLRSWPSYVISVIAGM